MIFDVIFIFCYDKNPPQNSLLSPQNSLIAQFLYNAYQRILYFTVIMSLIVFPDATFTNLPRNYKKKLHASIVKHGA